MKKLLIVAMGMAALSGCATIVEGSDQSITVNTNPPGASCLLKRGGVTIAAVDPTPGSANVSKSKDPIGVQCSKDGFRTAESGLSSDFEGMTLGNILIGGVVGVAIDAGSGAMNKYPEHVSVQMRPKSFSSVAARKRFYDQEIARAQTEAENLSDRIRSKCSERDKDRCEQQIAEIDRSLAATVAGYKAERAGGS